MVLMDTASSQIIPFFVVFVNSLTTSKLRVLAVIYKVILQIFFVSSI